MSRKGELSIPPDAAADERAVEIVRVWAAGDKHRFVLCTEVWDDPGAWGLMLVDLARHAAKAYAMNDGLEAEAVLDRIKQGFDAEWEFPTD
jgi:hypothetical protein